MASVVTDLVERRVAEALTGYDRGWSFVPLNGKQPVQKGWSKAPRAARAEVEKWVQQGNIGLRTGRPSGIVVVDLDVGCDIEGLAPIRQKSSAQEGGSPLLEAAFSLEIGPLMLHK